MKKEDIFDSPDKGGLTSQDFIDMMNELEKKSDLNKNMHAIFGGDVMLGCSDELFKGFYNNPNIQIMCSAEDRDLIDERAKKLKLI